MESEGAGRASVSFTPAEEEKFLAMSRTPQIYEKMASSISPSISGDYTVDIKKALACLLFGGSRKVRQPYVVPGIVLLSSGFAVTSGLECRYPYECLFS